MSQVEDALRSQKKTWREISQRILEEHWIQCLPKNPPERILLIGEGSSYFSARLTGYFLIRHPRFARLPILAVPSSAIGQEIFPKKGDWVFAMTHRGKTETTLKAIDQCNQAGAFSIRVSGQSVPELSSVKFTLPTSSIEKCEPHTIGMTGGICAVSTLLLGQSIADIWKKLSEVPDPVLSDLQSRAGNGPTLILGEWEGEWIALEIRLKLIEMAQLRPQVFGSEEFFHGPQHMSQNEKIWYIEVPGDSRSKQIQSELKIEAPTREPLAWISSLIELQWLSLATALNLGKNPDGIIS